MSRPKPALRVELLFYLTFLAAFAILVGVATSQLALAIAPERGVALVVVFVAAEVGIFVLYGRSLVTRLVLRPLARVMDTADAVADGDLAARAPDADTRDFATLAERLNREDCQRQKDERQSHLQGHEDGSTGHSKADPAAYEPENYDPPSPDARKLTCTESSEGLIATTVVFAPVVDTLGKSPDLTAAEPSDRIRSNSGVFCPNA